MAKEWKFDSPTANAVIIVEERKSLKSSSRMMSTLKVINRLKLFATVEIKDDMEGVIVLILNNGSNSSE